MNKEKQEKKAPRRFLGLIRPATTSLNESQISNKSKMKKERTQ